MVSTSPPFRQAILLADNLPGAIGEGIVAGGHRVGEHAYRRRYGPVAGKTGGVKSLTGPGLNHSLLVIKLFLIYSRRNLTPRLGQAFSELKKVIAEQDHSLQTAQEKNNVL